MTRKFFFFSEMGYNAYPLEALEQYFHFSHTVVFLYDEANARLTAPQSPLR